MTVLTVFTVVLGVLALLIGIKGLLVSSVLDMVSGLFLLQVAQIVANFVLIFSNKEGGSDE